MWLLGLLIGAGFGVVFGHPFNGALLGLIIGILVARKKDPVAADPGGRLRAMEARMTEMEKGYVSLKARLHQLEGVAPISTRPEPATPAAQTEGPWVQPSQAPLFQGRAESERAAETVPALVSPGEPKPANEPVRKPALEFPPDWDSPLGPESDPLAELWRRLISGNILAKIGVALLFFGVASALKLAAQHGWFPPLLRLVLGGAAGGAMIWFGWSRRDDPAHRAFALVLQGGGFGLLYLMVYFALAWYELVGHGLAFVLFALLGVGCAALAMHLEGPILAVFGLAGAFLAPILASSGEGNHIALFSYYLLLNGFIVWVAWSRNWPALTVTGFVFTFIVGLAWAQSRYNPEFYVSTQVFLLLFFLLYSAMPVLFAHFRAAGRAAWSQSILLFGTPIAAIVLQAPLVDDFEYGLAWSAFLAGLYYLTLWVSLANRDEEPFAIVRVTHFGAGVGLLTLAVPLAFGAVTTVAVWSVEGAATLWLSLRLARPAGQWFGLLVQLGAGFWLFLNLPDLSHSLPLANPIFTGGVLLALAGLTSAGLLRFAPAGGVSGNAEVLLAWGLLWWYGAWLGEIQRFAEIDHQPESGLLLFAITGLAGELFGRRCRWTAPRLAGTLVLPAAVFATGSEMVGINDRVLLGYMIVTLPLALAVHYWALFRREDDKIDLPEWSGVFHLGAAWLIAFVLTHDAFDLAAQESGDGVWESLSLGLAPAGLLYLTTEGVRSGFWPFSSRPRLYCRGFVLPTIALLVVWFVAVNFLEPGGDWGLYVPLVNRLDLGLVLVLWAIVHTRHLDGDLQGRPHRVTLPLVFVAVSGLCARLAHYWGEVAFNPWALLQSGLVQALLSVAWTLFAIAMMLYGVATQRRDRWFAGFGVLALVGVKLLLFDLRHSGTATWTASLIGIALLVLAAGYFAPAPPKAMDPTANPS